MLFNFGKCKCLHTGHGNEDAQYTMGDTVLNTTLKEKDLGLTISADMKISATIPAATINGSKLLDSANWEQSLAEIDEVFILKRLLQLKALGKVFNLEETIGEYECSELPSALFELNGSMRHGCKTGWMRIVLKETHKLQKSDNSTVLVVDTMCFIQHHPFLEGETFSQYQERLLRKLMRIAPANCNSIHLREIGIGITMTILEKKQNDKEGMPGNHIRTMM